MNVSKRSWHYWVYTHTFVNTPKDGCSYLRKLGWACLWFIPLTLYFIPNLLVEAVKSIYQRRKFEYPVYVSKIGIAFFQLIAAGFLICMVILMWYHMPSVVFTEKNADWHVLFLLGFVGWAVVIILSAICGVLYTIQSIIYWFKGRSHKDHKPTLLSIYIKAFKEKHCPKINIVD